MTTQIQKAKEGVITPEMESVASAEGLSPEYIREGVARGEIVVVKNARRSGIAPLGIGRGLRTKINANIGTSRDYCNIDEEREKLRILASLGSDAVMDLSTGGPMKEIRRIIIENSPIVVGTVPIYQAAVEAAETKGSVVRMDVNDIFRVIEEHASDGIDFITVHCGLTKAGIQRLKNEGRLLDIVSRGGAFLLEWMLYNKKENPLYEEFDRLLDIALRYDLTLSLGDGLRPGCLADATDRAQIQELLTIGELTERAWNAGVQVIIEGPGHVPINQIETNVRLEKEICKGAPFYVLGPLVTDIAPGYDHITAAIGGAIAGAAGADFLCYVTPSEHLRLPTIDDVREGVIASKIAAHAADIAKGIKGAVDRDVQMSMARKSLNWERQIALSLDPEKARRLREESTPSISEVCTMCGEFCAIKTVREYLKSK
ncbi:MAG: phosphomethylpyrimidine synthase ThiC [Nitrospirota bacterium]